jgi:cbb3-type cytochrome oxidase subunit 3
MIQLNNPSLWGPSLWNSIHYIALGYPENNPSDNISSKYVQFFKSLSVVIPCDECKIHFNQMLINYPPNLKSKETLFKWSVDIHNLVNKRLNKKELTYEEAIVHLLNPITKYNKATEINIYFNNLWFYIFIILFFILILYFVFKK